MIERLPGFIICIFPFFFFSAAHHLQAGIPEVAGSRGSRMMPALDESIVLAGDSVAAMPNTEVVFPIRVKGFKRMITGQGTITFNTAVVSFMGVEQFGLPGMGAANFGTTQTANGKLAFSWDDATLAGQTLADDAVLFAIRFFVKGTYGTSSPVAFTNSPTPLEFVDDNFALASLTLQPGTMQVSAFSITTQSLTGNSFCAGSSAAVAFTLIGPYEAGTAFTVQLSDASGSFASATAIGTGTASPVNAVFPLATPPGAGYRLRVVSGAPAIQGAGNGSDITIHAVPAVPATTDNSRCGPGLVSLTVAGTPAGGFYRWYSATAGGTPIPGVTAATWSPDLLATTTYYVASVSPAGCESSRTAVTATIHAIPAAPGVRAGSLCGPGPVTLAASGTPPGGSYRWYTVAVGGTPIPGATAVTYTTPSLSGPATYYVSVMSSAGCESVRTAVAATIKVLPAAPWASAAPSQVGGQLSLAASTVAGATYSWSGPKGFTSTSQNPAISNAQTAHSGTYTVTATIDGCSSAAGSVTVTVVDVPTSTLDVDSVSGVADTEVLVPVRVKGFTNIQSMQYSINWDAGVAALVGVESFGLTGLNEAHFGTSQAAAGKISLSWNDSALDSYSLADNAVLFNLRFRLMGSMGQSSPVTITGSPTPVELSGSSGFLVPVQTLAGAVTVRKRVTISGKVKSENQEGIKTVTLLAAGGEAPASGLTQADGLYAFDVLQNGTYVISPQKNDDSLAYNGVTTLDIALIRRHILNVLPLASPYKLLAADVDASQTVSTGDIAAIRKVILTLEASFPGKRRWTFVPQSYPFADPANPFPFKDSVQVHANIVRSLSGQDFIGVKLGDVDNSWDARNARFATHGRVSVHMNDQQVVPGTEVLVPVKVYDFKDISGYQFTLTWDPEVLAFASVENAALQGAFGTHQVANGKLTTAWDDPGGKSQDLAEGSPVFYVRFKAIGPIDTETEVAVNSTLTRSLAYNQDLEQLQVVAGKARVRLRSTAKPVAEGYALYQNVPNPIKAGETSIRFTIPRAEEVSLRIYNPLGQLMKTFRGHYAAGEHEILWNGQTSAGQPISRGTYFYHLQAGDFTDAKRALVID